jgi:hypothetical protein
MAWKLEAYDLDPETVKAWFAAGPVSTDYTGYVAENEAVFVRGNEALRLQCSYRDGCPTCGGTYEMSWVSLRWYD